MNANSPPGGVRWWELAVERHAHKECLQRNISTNADQLPWQSVNGGHTQSEVGDNKDPRYGRTMNCRKLTWPEEVFTGLPNEKHHEGLADGSTAAPKAPLSNPREHRRRRNMGRRWQLHNTR